MEFDWDESDTEESDTEAGAPSPPPVFVMDLPALHAGPVPRWHGHTHEDIDTFFVAVRAMAFSDAQQP